MSTSGKVRKLAVVAVLAALAACAGMSQFLKAYGYVELRPPSSLLAPGSVVAISSRAPFTAKIICGARASLGADWAPMESRTELPAYTRKKTTSFNMDVNLLTQIKSHAEYSAIESINIVMKNARIVEASDSDVMTNLHKRSWQCSQAVSARRKAGFEVTMVSSALIADVEYDIVWDQKTNVSTDVKIQALKDLSVQLGGGSACVDQTTIKANGLVWGIKDDLFLAALSMPEENVPTVQRGSRLFKPDDLQGFDMTPDAPVVTPTTYAGPRDANLIPVEGSLPSQPTRPRKDPRRSAIF